MHFLSTLIAKGSEGGWASVGVLYHAVFPLHIGCMLMCTFAEVVLESRCKNTALSYVTVGKWKNLLYMSLSFGAAGEERGRIFNRIRTESRVFVRKRKEMIRECLL